MDAAFLYFDALLDHLGNSLRSQVIMVGYSPEIGVHAPGIHTANADIVPFDFLGQDLADAFHGVLGGAVATGHRAVKEAAAA